MSKLTFKIFILFVLFTLNFSATIRGKVYDENNGSPLIGANVYLDNTSLGGSTNVDGQYIITDIPNNSSYTITVKYLGYKQFTQEINLFDKELIDLDISLSPSNIKVKGAEIVGSTKTINDKITNSPATKELISSERIQVEASTNLGSYLKGLKGVDYTASGMDSYSISVRGFNSSFSSRLLTLTDGRVANIPALRVVSYNTIPQSQDDIEKMEVILGPATALYGANAHSGVVNIVSKPPASSEGFSLHVSGTNDDRSLRKINGRYAKKMNDNLSFKISGSYLNAYEWEFISEDEWKNHQYTWIGAPNRTIDGYDNNPWNEFAWDDSVPANWENIKTVVESSGWNIEEYWEDYNNDGVYQQNEFIGNPGEEGGWDTVTKYTYHPETGELILIGNGEGMNTGDPDGDGIMGEDWVNGYDDDGDGLIDEDFFRADGVDNDGDCPGDTNGDGIECGPGDVGVDENIDNEYDLSYDGMDNNGNGQVDESWEYDHDGNGTSNWGESLDSDLKIIIYDGRKEEFLNGQENSWHYINGEVSTDDHIRGDYIWDEDNFTIMFDVFTDDFGDDGLAGDKFIDVGGNNVYEVGEQLQCSDYYEDCSNATWFQYGHYDNGLDGIPFTFDEGEGDGIWQPGDAWVDFNNNGVVDITDGYDIEYSFDEEDDLWPPPNGIYDEGEYFEDWGQDGIHNTGDPGEGNGLNPLDNDELDGNYDTGDGCYGCNSDEIELVGRFQQINDTNGDTLNDYPDFEIDNRKVEARIDINGIPFLGMDDLDVTFQSGYSWSKSQVVTGVGRYLLDGWEYTFNQLKLSYNNWFFQTYLNSSYSGDTRGYLRGDLITDLSKNRAYQIQNNFKLPAIDTDVTWGIDYFRTEPVTKGTILNDGPNGRDENGNGIIDDPAEFDNPIANEGGLYFQSSSKLSKLLSDKWELVLAARLDYHDQLEEDDGLNIFGHKWQFGPKFGLMYDPHPSESWRVTFGRAFNTPTTTQLFTNYYVQDFRIFNVYLRGNKDGTNYLRVGDDTNISQPQYYDSNGDLQYYGKYNFGDDYIDRIQDMPYFFLYDTFEGVPSDWIPLDTTNFLVYIPEPNGDGYIVRPSDVKSGERYIPDIPAIKSEKINSFEIGYKKMFDFGAIMSLDYYVNHYTDFFSPATYITPTVIYRYNADGSEATVDDFEFAGFIPGNQNNSNPPYSTGWNGLDDDGDWDVWASDFGWDLDDKNGDGDPRDPGEWGFVDLETGEVYTPAQLGFDGNGLPWIYSDPLTNQYGINYNLLDKVGVDEWSPQEGMAEYECESYPCSSNNVQGRATSPPEIILGVLNYGNVWTQGIDMAFTQIINDEMFFNGNFSWYNTTEFYNELTKRNDPINAPKFKWNLNFNYKNDDYGMLSIAYRHVDQFEWQDGIWSGVIGPYNLFDLHYKYEISKHLSASISCLNIFNDVRREIVGGAKMGRQIVMRFSTGF
tara:strand:- start:12283 stop:16620 length:4338 start_codon:yes stop_codon:yes gene_type:complete